MRGLRKKNLRAAGEPEAWPDDFMAAGTSRIARQTAKVKQAEGGFYVKEKCYTKSRWGGGSCTLVAPAALAHEVN